jgi:hypothetical protein
MDLPFPNCNIFEGKEGLGEVNVSKGSATYHHIDGTPSRVI